MKLQLANTTLPIRVLLGPEQDISSGLLEAFPRYVLSSKECSAEGVISICNIDFSVQIDLLYLSSDLEKQILFRILACLAIKSAKMNAAQKVMQLTAPDLFEPVDIDRSELNVNRVRDIMKRITAAVIHIHLKSSNGDGVETYGNFFQGITVDQGVANNPFDINITFEFSNFIASSFAPPKESSALTNIF